MSPRDYSRQVAKRQRIRNATLIVGVDIGKTFNAVEFMDKEGNVLGNCAKLYTALCFGTTGGVAGDDFPGESVAFMGGMKETQTSACFDFLVIPPGFHLQNAND